MIEKRKRERKRGEKLKEKSGAFYKHLPLLLEQEAHARKLCLTT